MSELNTTYSRFLAVLLEIGLMQPGQDPVEINLPANEDLTIRLRQNGISASFFGEIIEQAEAFRRDQQRLRAILEGHAPQPTPVTPPSPRESTPSRPAAKRGPTETVMRLDRSAQMFLHHPLVYGYTRGTIVIAGQKAWRNQLRPVSLPAEIETVSLDALESDHPARIHTPDFVVSQKELHELQSLMATGLMGGDYRVGPAFFANQLFYSFTPTHPARNPDNSYPYLVDLDANPTKITIYVAYANQDLQFQYFPLPDKASVRRLDEHIETFMQRVNGLFVFSDFLAVRPHIEFVYKPDGRAPQKKIFSRPWHGGPQPLTALSLSEEKLPPSLIRAPVQLPGVSQIRHIFPHHGELDHLATLVKKGGQTEWVENILHQLDLEHQMAIAELLHEEPEILAEMEEIVAMGYEVDINALEVTLGLSDGVSPGTLSTWGKKRSLFEPRAVARITQFLVKS